MIDVILNFLPGQPPVFPVFIEGVGITENTVIMIALIGILVSFHVILKVPIICMLGSFLISIPAVLETHVYYFPYLNLLVILIAVYVAFDGFKTYTDPNKRDL